MIGRALDTSVVASTPSVLPREITLSVVSHRQNSLVNQLLADVESHCAERVTLLLTENVPDPVPLETRGLSCPVQVIVNEHRKGFGANHNSAFARRRTPYFCVSNPDIHLPADPFPATREAPRGRGGSPRRRGP